MNLNHFKYFSSRIRMISQFWLRPENVLTAAEFEMQMRTTLSWWNVFFTMLDRIIKDSSCLWINLNQILSSCIHFFPSELYLCISPFCKQLVSQPPPSLSGIRSSLFLAIPSTHYIFTHVHGTILFVKFNVKTTCVANNLTLYVTPPQRSSLCFAIWAKCMWAQPCITSTLCICFYISLKHVIRRYH